LRRLLIAVVALAVADRFEPALLRSVESARYDNPARDFRFENSDLFGLGPLLAYLHDHPQGPRRRVLFLGNSVVYGYAVSPSDALPGRYQRLDPSAKVFNAGINAMSNDSAFLIAKAAMESVDLTYVLHGPPKSGETLAILPSLIPVEDADVAQFHLTAPSAAERLLSRPLNHWRLYRDAYRLQAALFGSSTRQYIYLHKGALARALVARLRAAALDDAPSAEETIPLRTPLADALPDPAAVLRLRAQSPDLWRLGDQAVARRAHVVFLHLPDYSVHLGDVDAGVYNRVFAPYARVVVFRIPPRLTWDGTHLTGAGAAALARALWNIRPEDPPR